MDKASNTLSCTDMHCLQHQAMYEALLPLQNLMIELASLVQDADPLYVCQLRAHTHSRTFFFRFGGGDSLQSFPFSSSLELLLWLYSFGLHSQSVLNVMRDFPPVY